MSADDPTSPGKGFDPDVIPLVAWGLGFLALATLRAMWGAVPQDMSAYLAAADVASRGLSPYTDIAQSTLYQGLPYIYYPGLMPLLYLVHLIPVKALLFVETLGRGLVGVYVMRAFVQRLGVRMPWQGLVLAWLCLDPFVTDLYVGNLELWMCALWVGVMQMCDQPMERMDRKRVAVACVIGALMIIKPMWGIPAAYVAALQRRWDVFVGLGVGAACVLGLGGVAHREHLEAWWAMVAAVRSTWQAFDLGSADPMLVVVGGFAWLVGAVKLWWTRRDEAWLWGAASVLVWPRLGFYCYVLAVPLMLWGVRSKGRLIGALCALPFSLVVSFALPEATALRLCIMYCAMLGLCAAWLLEGSTPPETEQPA